MQLVSSLRRCRIAAIAGDLTTTIDAERIRATGANVVQINTGRECHLDANMVKKAISKLDLDNVDLLLIENVGNLICPADFPLGSHKRIVVISVTEGPYMILKHPFIFVDADVVAINKIDLCREMKVNPDELEQQVLNIKPNITVAKTNCRTGEGIVRVIEALGLSDASRASTPWGN
jgi:hydrogenase nickel incorporation protein HypB